MPDGRRNNKGTKGNNGGRPSKAEELKASAYATDAITKEYGSVEAFWEFIASQSRDSKDHLKMILEYAFGKAPDKVDVTSGGDKITGVTYVVKRRD
jgi:hypothetical protein